jgi:hypothetical protein
MDASTLVQEELDHKHILASAEKTVPSGHDMVTALKWEHAI